MRLDGARRFFTRLSQRGSNRTEGEERASTRDRFERSGRLTRTTKLALIGGGIASTGALIAGLPAEQPELPARDALPSASSECLGVRSSDGVISGQLPDGRRWSVVLDQARQEAARGKLSKPTETALCQIQGGALVDLRARLAKIDSGDKENFFIATGDLVAQAEAAVILSQDDLGDPRTDPKAAADQLEPLLSAASDPKTAPERLRTVYLELVKLAPQLAERGEALANRTPSEDVAHIAQGIARDRDLREEHPGLPLGGEKSPVLTELKPATDAKQLESSAEFAALSTKAEDGAKSALASLVLAANPTWVADHPNAEPTPEMVAAVKSGIARGKTFEEVRAAAEKTYRHQPGVAEAHVKKLVSSMIPAHQNVLREPAMKAAAAAWKEGKSDKQIRSIVRDRIDRIAEQQAKSLVSDLFHGRSRGLESQYDRMVRIVKPLWLDGASKKEIRNAVFADWNQHAPRFDQSRVIFGGATVNRYTAQLLARAQVLSDARGGPTDFSLSQGSYSTSVSASAGTHAGGGAFDMRVGNWSERERHIVVAALREAGFAAWYRTPADGFDPHIHGIAIGDRSASSEAKSQVSDYFAGRNGLANNGPDRDASKSGRPIPAWA